MASLIFRFGWVGACNHWRSAPGGRPSFSPHGQHRDARYSRVGPRSGGGGTPRSMESRAEGSQGVAAAIAWPSQLCPAHTSCFFCRSRHFSCSIVSTPRDSVTGAAEIVASTPVVAGAFLLVAIIAAPHQHNLALFPPSFSRERSTSTQSSYLFPVLVFPLPLAVCWIANRFKTRRWMIVIFFSGLAVPCFFVWTAACLVLGDYRVWRAGRPAFRGPAKARSYRSLSRALDSDSFPYRLLYSPSDEVSASLPPRRHFPLLPVDGRFSFRVARAAALVLIVASTGYSLLILRSDAEFAEFGRDAMYR